MSKSNQQRPTPRNFLAPHALASSIKPITSKWTALSTGTDRAASASFAWGLPLHKKFTLSVALLVKTVFPAAWRNVELRRVGLRA